MSETQSYYDARKRLRQEDPIPREITMTPVLARGLREFGETFMYGSSIRTWEARCAASQRASRARRVKARIRRDRTIALCVTFVLVVALSVGEIIARR